MAFVKGYNDPGGVSRGVGDVLLASELSGRNLVESSSPVQAVPESFSKNEMVQAGGRVSSATDQGSVRRSSRVARKHERFQNYILD